MIASWPRAGGAAPKRGCSLIRPSQPALLLFFVASILAGAIGQSFAFDPQLTVTLWPPVGLLMGLLLVSPPPRWPWWLAASGLAELTCNALWWSNPLLPALGYMAANLAEALTGAVLLRWAAGQRFAFRTPRETALFALCCALVAPMVSATGIAAIDQLIGKADFSMTWPLVWLGDASGALVFAPLVLVVVNVWQARTRTTALTIVEIAALAGLLVLVAAGAFTEQWQVHYLALPLLMWAALRFQIRGAVGALAVLVVAFAALSRALPQSLDFPERSALDLQSFFVVAALSGLLVATLSHQNARARAALGVANARLEDRVRDRTARLVAALRAGRLGVIEVDLASGAVTLDPAARHLLGLRGGRFAPAELLAQIVPADAARISAELQHAARAPSAHRITLSCRTRLGRSLLIDADIHARSGQAGLLIGVIKDITDRVAAERRQQLLVDELSHRVKNTLATVQAIAQQSLRRTTDPERRDSLIARLTAYARGHDLLAGSNWQAAPLDQVVAQALVPFGGGERFEIAHDGQPVRLPPREALALALALHELCTNAIKHGALSVPAGRIFIDWEQRDAGQRFAFNWRETGGPPVAVPTRRGFGSTLLQRTLALDLRGTVDVNFREDGLECRIIAPIPADSPQPPALGEETA